MNREQRQERHREFGRRRTRQMREERGRDAQWGKLLERHQVRYEPLDETLGGMFVRVLRALRRFADWAEPRLSPRIEVLARVPPRPPGLVLDLGRALANPCREECGVVVLHEAGSCCAAKEAA